MHGETLSKYASLLRALAEQTPLLTQGALGKMKSKEFVLESAYRGKLSAILHGLRFATLFAASNVTHTFDSTQGLDA